MADFESLEGFEEVVRMPSPSNSFQKKSTIQVKLKRQEGETYVLCLSSERVEKDRAIREKQEGRLLADLVKLETRIAKKRLVQPLKIGEAMGRLKERYPRVARYYDIAYNPETKTFTYEVVAGKRAKAEELDGSYLLPTGSGVVLRIRKGSTPEAPHREIYRLLDVPTQIIKPRKTWTDLQTAQQHSDVKNTRRPE